MIIKKQLAPEEERCLDGCLKVEEDCLLESISMYDCVVAFDTCHQACYPNEHVSQAPAAADGPNKHKDVTEDTEDSQDGDDNDEDDDSEDQEDNEGGVGSAPAAGISVKQGKAKAAAVKSVKTKMIGKEKVGLTLTPEEINRMQESYQDEEIFDIIPAPKGGEDDDEFNDDPSDY